MKNSWVNKNLKVINMTPYKVDELGYLYLFECERIDKNGKEIPFLQMTQTFQPYKLHLAANNLYRELKLQNIEFTSLNRKDNRDVQWAIEKAISAHDKIKEINHDELDEDYWNYKEEPSADPDDVSKIVKNKIDEWKKEDKGSWYTSAQSFVKNIMNKKS
jgi:hypothetical protein